MNTLEILGVSLVIWWSAVAVVLLYALWRDR